MLEQPGNHREVERRHHAHKGSARAWLASHALPVAIASFVGGVATGVGLYAAVASRPVSRVTSPERPASPPAPTPVEPVWRTVEPTAPAPLVPPAPPPPHASAPAPGSLPPERDLLVHARSLLAAGDAAGALASLEDHASRFPKPQLGEEREALAIQALVALGRYDDARARARRFHEGSPNSLFAPVIDAAIGLIP